ncbi:hypothetical protein [Ornithinimicrobium kibberense]|uniref:hypothetical protein n=1 Tax=Ornithinimicrobium kibberense TaxID=282060 RepID=UPI0036151C4C
MTGALGGPSSGVGVRRGEGAGLRLRLRGHPSSSSTGLVRGLRISCRAPRPTDTRPTPPTRMPMKKPQ